jgi:hypothetical protein
MHLDVQLLHGRLSFHNSQVKGIVRQEPQARHPAFELVQQLDRREESLVQAVELFSRQVVVAHDVLAAPA